MGDGSPINCWLFRHFKVGPPNKQTKQLKSLPAESLWVDEFKSVSSNGKSWMLKLLHSAGQQPTHTYNTHY